MRPVPCRALSVAAALVALSAARLPAAAAETNVFNGALNNDFSNGQNWTKGRAPLSTDNAVIDRGPQLWLGARPGAAGSLFVGLSGTASLYAETALNVSQLTLGSRAGSSGAITAVGSAGRLSATATVTVGSNGRGEIDLYRGASLRALNVMIGSGTTGYGTVILAGQSALSASGTLGVGGAGKGRINLSGGALVNAGTLAIGGVAGGSGAVTASGSGTRITAGAALIGKAGGGALQLTTGAGLAARSLTVADARGSVGQLALSGGGTTLAVSAGMTVGQTGRGVATVFTGAKVTAGALTVGANAGSSGSLTAGNGGTALAVSGNMTVGSAGKGSVMLQDGAVGTAGHVVLGASGTGNGTLTLNGAGTLLRTATPVEIGRSGTGALLLTSEARLAAASIDLGRYSGSTGTLSIGARHGDIARGAGRLETSAIRFGAGHGSLVFNIGGPTYTLAAAMSGRGTILADAGSIVLTGNSSAFTGATRITGGTLAVNGSLGGTVSIGGYGTLAGTGSVGSVTVGNGGTIAPAGSGTGRLSVQGNLAIGSGGHLQASISPSTNRADLLSVSGQTTIASGAVLDVVQESAVTLSRQDRILTSAGGVTGRFDNVTSNYAFITPTVTNDGHNLFVTLTRNGTRFASAASDPGARTVAAIGETLDADNPLYRQIASLSSAQAGRTFGELAGTIHASPALNGFDVSRFARSAAVERVMSAPAGSGRSLSAMTAYVDPRPFDAASAFAAVLSEEARRGPIGWARAYGGYSTRAMEGGDRLGSTGGMLFGWDVSVGDDTRIGLLGGIGAGHVRESAKDASADSRDYTLGLYGGTEAGPVSLRFGTTYVHQDIDTARKAHFNGLTENLAAGYGADSVQAYGEVAHRFELSGMSLEPFANLSMTWQRTEGFEETGGHAALSGSTAESTAVETVIGLRAARQVSLLGQDGQIRGMLGWNHAFEPDGDGPLFSFAGSNGFRLASADTAGDSLAVEAGLDLFADEGRMNVGLTYGGNFAAAGQSHLLKLTLSRQF